ncbi:hypothetical protein [Gordonia rhizosphera]|nr:hypothetical protein [Gordonia rhizosphera]
MWGTVVERCVRRFVLSVSVTVGAAAILTLPAGTAAAAPVGQVDAGVPFSSVVYGTGCLYDLTVPVNASGQVTFWERNAAGGPEQLIGSAMAEGAIATIRWVPRQMGSRQLYAKQGGVTGPIAVVPVHQGHGSAWACWAV